MTRTEIEREIRRLLAEENRAIELSNALFSPGGLFAQLASSKDERRTVAQSELFETAQARVAELRRDEAKQFAKAVEEHLDVKEQRQVTLEQSSSG